MAGKHVEHRQRAHHAVFFGVKQLVADPALIHDPGVFVLCNLGHARGAAGVEIGGDPVFFGVLEAEGCGLRLHFLVEAAQIRVARAFDLRAHQRHDPAFGRRQVAVEVNFQNRLHVWRVAHGLRRLLRHIRLGEGFERDDNLGVGFAQDGGDLFRFEQRVDRVDDPGNGGGNGRDNRLGAIGHDHCDHIRRPHPQRTEQVCRLRHLRVKLGPGQCLGLVVGAGKQLECHGRTVRKLVLGDREHFINRRGHIARLPRHLGLVATGVLERGN